MHAAFYAYRLLARFAEIIPASAVAPISKAAGAAVPHLDSTRCRLVESNIARVKGRPATRGEVQAAFSSYTRYWLESLRLPIVPKEMLEKSVQFSGFENVERAREVGKGLILAVPHVGNWDAAGAWFAQTGIPLTVVVERIEPAKLRQWFLDFRSSLGMRVLFNDSKVGGELTAALRRNEAIALLCDRDVDGSGIDIEFFGEKTKLPKGPAALALRTGAALLPAVSLDAPRGHDVRIGPPVDVSRSGTLREDITRVTEDLTREIEAFIRVAPEQWHLFQPNWPSDIEAKGS